MNSPESTSRTLYIEDKQEIENRTSSLRSESFNREEERGQQLTSSLRAESDVRPATSKPSRLKLNIIFNSKDKVRALLQRLYTEFPDYDRERLRFRVSDSMVHWVMNRKWEGDMNNKRIDQEAYVIAWIKNDVKSLDVPYPKKDRVEQDLTDRPQSTENMVEVITSFYTGSKEIPDKYRKIPKEELLKDLRNLE